MNAQSARKISFTSRFVDTRDDGGDRKPLVFGLSLQRDPEFWLECNAGAMSGDGERPLLHLSETAARYFGWIISSGRTMRSNSSAVTSPVLSASSLSVVPFLCAVLAIFAALS